MAEQKSSIKPIIIRIEGGVLQDIENIPTGIVVHVYDYDNTGDKDEEGRDCSHSIYGDE